MFILQPFWVPPFAFQATEGRQGSRFWVQGFGFRVQGSGFKVLGSRLIGSGLDLYQMLNFGFGI
jgi:hypothetical protein